MEGMDVWGENPRLESCTVPDRRKRRYEKERKVEWEMTWLLSLEVWATQNAGN
jgi:hypothetical protein